MTDDEGLESERTETVDSEGTDAAESDRTIEFDSSRTAEFESDAASGSGPSVSDRDDVDRTGPLGDLAASVADRGDAAEGGAAASSPAFDELFDREDVANIDRDRLWDRLEADETAAPSRDEERELREIEKRNYCHQCERFASPPTVACTREGTDILEMPSLERFRVADCPVVLEDEALENRE